VQGRIKALDKIEKTELPKKRQVVKFEFRVPPRSGEQVAVLENLHKSYGPRVIYEGVNLTIRRGERWAVMGRNGAGKTTLLKMIAGASAPDAGSVRLGASLQMGYFAQQSLELLNSDLTVIEQLQQDFPQDGLGSLRNLAEHSGSPAKTWPRRSAHSPAEKNRGWQSRACSTTRRTSWCSTNRRIIWILPPRKCWWTP